jgi:Ca-activated chloride channel homolog
MSGPPLDRATALVSRALDALAPADTFQLVAFDGAAQAMTPAPVLGTPEHVADAKAWLARLSGGGGTEMLEGIRAALTPPEDPRRLRMVVFCTDGFIGNEAEIIDAVEALRGSARVFGFGIGSSVNRYLVEGVARAGRGAAEVVALDEAPDDAVDRLFRRLDRPVLTDLEVAFEGAQVTDLLPARLPDLFAGQPLVVAARVAGGAPTHARLRGRLGEQPWAARLAIRAGPADPGLAQPVAGTLWARRRIDALLSAQGSAPAPEAVEEIVALALRFKLVTAYTSCVAVEHEVRLDPSLPLARALVPNELPAGVSYEGALGRGTEIAVLPARVKPGDPELRVAAPPGTVAVRVALPFEARAREAIPDPDRGDWVLRFLVPPAWPDGSWDARVTIVHASGAEEERVAPIRVDTTPAAIAVLSAPERAAPGEIVRLLLKPALPLERTPALLGRHGGLGHALKGAMEVKEVLVRAPWGETVRARMEGPLGAWVAILRVPGDAAEGAAELELAASDAAGNVSRRRLAVAIAAGPAGPASLQAGVVGVALGAVTALVLAVALVAAVRRRRRGPRPLAQLLLAGSVRRDGGRRW